MTELTASSAPAVAPPGRATREIRSLAVFHLGGVGGPQRSLGGAMGWLRERGTVEFIVPEAGPAAAVYGRLGAVTVSDYSALTYARGIRPALRAVRQLVSEVRFFRRELRRRRPDLVVVVTTVLPAVLIAARLERIPSVVYAAELYQQEWKGSPLLRVWGGLLAAGTAWLADGIVCCSDAVARQFPTRSRKPLSVAYPPIGREYEQGDRERGRARYDVEDAQPCIAVVGSLSRGRGQDVAIRAMPLIQRRFPAARLLVVGAAHPRPADLAFAEELRTLTDELGVSGAVVFAEPTDAMADVYAASDIVVNPARFEEPFGRVAPEALIAGRPVVATSVGAIPEVIRDGVDGLLVPRDDHEALAAAVERHLDDPARASDLTASGRQAVLEKFGEAQDLAAWKRVLEAVLLSGRG
jgi:glycosyltransferase involved in cell wall biosynthesis